MSARRRITLSLISHTNVGKTTLARTLLRRDVGEVRDEAHVTEDNESHVLVATADAELVLWDTPGFGDTARLMRRLRHEADPLGWFLHQVWDRFVDRPMWCGQQAARNVREEADLVLYLVNAAEHPDDAGYAALELELLTWIGRPTLLLLNQVGPEPERELAAWNAFVASRPIVRGVLSLDAFARCWTEEGVLLERVAGLLEGEQREAMQALLAKWNADNQDVFRSSVAAIADYLADAALDRATLGESEGTDEERSESGFDLLSAAWKRSPLGRKRAMGELSERLDRATTALMERLILAHGLVGDSALRIERRLQDFQVRGATVPLNEVSGAFAGAVLSGALGGLAADALSGGLTLGGGMIAGGILGALGGTALARGYRLIRGDQQPTVGWSPEFLDMLFRQALLRYLAVAHYGRGRGGFADLEHPESWVAAVDAARDSSLNALREVWTRAEDVSPRARERAVGELQSIVESALRGILP